MMRTCTTPFRDKLYNEANSTINMTWESKYDITILKMNDLIKINIIKKYNLTNANKYP